MRPLLESRGALEVGAGRALRVPLRFKVVASVSLLLVGVSSAVAWALIRHERFYLQREAEKRVVALAEGLAASARDPLLVGDELRLAPLVAAFEKNTDVLYAYVADHDGVVLYPSGRAREESGSRSPSRGDELRATARVAVEDTTVGTAVVALSPGFIDEALRSTALGLLLPLGAGTLIAVLGTFVLTSLHVRRIETLDRAVVLLAEGDHQARAPLAGNDEIGRLADRFNRMVEQLDTSRRELESGFMETVSALAAAIEAKDAYTRGHCERVARLSRAIAGHVGMDAEQVRNLELAAILHDVGKIGVPADILGKVGRLTKDEMRSMRRHSEIGERILQPLSFLGAVTTHVRNHHEEFDGSGYPDGLVGGETSIEARIIHLADAYDAMTSCRPYRRALPHEEAVRRIVADSGRQFDPELVAAFLELESRGEIRAIRNAVAEAVPA